MGAWKEREWVLGDVSLVNLEALTWRSDGCPFAAALCDLLRLLPQAGRCSDLLSILVGQGP